MKSIHELSATTPAASATSQIIDPQNVRWKFFNLDEAGNVSCSNVKPQDKSVVAIVNTSWWFGDKQGTPKAMKGLISKILNQDLGGRKPNLCIATPCSSLDEMREYYGDVDFGDVEDDYIAIRMHDDLRKGAVNFILGGAVGSMPAKEGAEQIASAIENGFSLWAVAGGNTLFPKLQLCEKYFAEKYESSQEEYTVPKTYLVGFSNVSNAQFYLRGLITPIHYFGAFKSVAGDPETNNLVIRVLEGEKELTQSRTMYSNNVEDVKNRYDAIKEKDDVVTNITFFPHSLNLACDATFPKFKDNEKIILGLEGYSQVRCGTNVHEALFKAFEVGAIDPKRVLFISIEDIIRMEEEFEVEREHGQIPESEIAQKKIEALADKFKRTPQEYIAESNAISAEEIERVKEVAKKFGIPVVDGGKKRAGHSKNPVIQPARVSNNLEFRENGEIVQTSIFVQEAREKLFSDVRKDPNRPAPDWSKLTRPSIYESGESLFCPAQNYEYSRDPVAIALDQEAEKEIQKAKLKPLNPDKVSSDLAEENLVVGTTLNIVEVFPDAIANKGMALHLAYRGSLSNQVAELYQIAESNQIKAAKFVVISLANPSEIAAANLEEFEDNRFNLIRKLFEDLQIKPPVFVTTHPIDQDKLVPLFSARVNLKEMLLEPEGKPVSSPTALSAKVVSEAAIGLELV